MKQLPLIILSFSLFCCQHESQFDLNKDLYHFSERMENGDTVQIMTDLSACMFFASETYTFTKQNENPHEKGDFPLVTVTYKKQNRKFYDDGLQDKFMKHDSLFAVKENIYPKDPFFKQEAPPPPTIIKNKKS